MTRPVSDAISLAMDTSTTNGDPKRPSVGRPGLVVPPGYTLHDVIGSGGMGIVYRATDLDLRREVAVKILQDRFAPESSTAARFLEEAHITGQLQHPGIPPVYKVASLPDGRPFLAMKLIKGQTLDELLKTGAPIKRLAVFEAIAQAVGYAHAHDVIHRDLKPANIMVGAFGEVQVMDWGLAKVLTRMECARPDDTDPEATTAPTLIRTQRDSDSSHTKAGSVLGTPTYMAPEQAAGEVHKVNQRSDVFGLGALLCVMLTDKPPFAGQDSESIRLNAVRGKMDEALASLATCDAEPAVVALCRECLSFEPTDRPADGNAVAKVVAELRVAAEERARAAELERAKAEVRTEEERKRACVQAAEQRKRRRLWIGLAATLLVGMVASAASAWWANTARLAEAEATEQARNEAIEKEKERQRAEEKERDAKTQAALATAVKDFLQFDVLRLADPATQREDGKLNYDAELKLRDVVLRAAEVIEDKFKEQPLVEAELRLTLGFTLMGMGRADLALTQRERARSLYTQHLGPDHPDTLVCMQKLASCYAELGRYADALRLGEETLSLMQQKLGPDHVFTLRSMDALGYRYMDLGRYAEAIKLHEEALTLQKQKFGPDHAETLWTRNNLGNSYHYSGREADALKLREETLALMKHQFGPDHPDTLRGMCNLAVSFNAVGRSEEALKLCEETLAIQMQKLGPDHPDTLMNLNNRALFYQALGHHSDALRLYEETLALRRKKLGPDHPDTLRGMRNLASSYARLDRQTDALKLREQTLTLMKQKLGPDHPDTLRTMNDLALSYAAFNRQVDALKLNEETLTYMRASSHPDLDIVIGNLANSYLDRGRHADALKLLEEALSLRQQKLGPTHRRTLSTRISIAMCYFYLRRPNDSTILFEETLAIQKEKLGADDPDTLRTMSNLAINYSQLGRQTDAVKLKEEVLEVRRRRFGADHRDTLMSMSDLAAAYVAMGRQAEALKLREEAFTLRKQKLGPDHADTLASMHSIAVSYHALGRHVDALKLLEETLALRQQKLGSDHSDTLLTHWGVIESLAILQRQNEALPRIDEVLMLADKAMAASKRVDPRLAPAVFAIRIKIYRDAADAGGCRATAELWEKRNLSNASDLYNAARWRGVTAAVQSKITGPGSPQLAKEDADRAMKWLTQAVSKGFKNRAVVEEEPDLDHLRERDDFKNLLDSLPKVELRKDGK